MRTRSLSPVLCLLQALCLLAMAPGLAAQSVSFASAPLSVTAGQSVTIRLNHQLSTNGQVRVQFYNDWAGVTKTSKVNISAGNRSTSLTLSIPASAVAGNKYRYHAELFDNQGRKVEQAFRANVRLTAGSTPTSVSFASAPGSVTAGSTYDIKVNYNLSTTGIVQVQFFTSGWQRLVAQHVNVPAGEGQKTISVRVPNGTAAGSSYRWQAVLYNRSWNKQKDTVKNGVSVGGDQRRVDPAGQTGRWTPGATISTGTGNPTKWFPKLGSNQNEYANTTENPLRYADDRNLAWMYSTSYAAKMPDGRGNYWLDGQGHLVMRIVTDKTESEWSRQKSQRRLSAFRQARGVGQQFAHGRALGRQVRVTQGRPALHQLPGSKPTSSRAGPPGSRSGSSPKPTARTTTTRWTAPRSTSLRSPRVPPRLSQYRVQRRQPLEGVWRLERQTIERRFDAHRAQPGGCARFRLARLRCGMDHVRSLKFYVDGELAHDHDQRPHSIGPRGHDAAADPRVPAQPLGRRLGRWPRAKGPNFSDDSSMREMSRVLVDYVHIHRK